MASRLTVKAFIGKEIRRAREAKGISRAKLAKPLMVSESLIVAWECGRVGIVPEHMRRLLGIPPEGTPGQPILEFPQEVFIRMIEDLMNGEKALEWEGKWHSAEELTRCLYTFDAMVINGLLQCSEYMQAVLPTEEAVKKRLERQRRYLSDDVLVRPRLVALMDESVLLRNVGGPETMARQMAFLLECAKEPNVLMQVVCMKSTVCARYRTPFMLAVLHDGREIAYSDGAISGEVIEQVEDVDILRDRFDRYRVEALRESETIDLIRKEMEQWTS